MTDEILVHISTAATRQNDNLYRSLGDAYLDFEPHKCHSDEPRQQHEEAIQYTTPRPSKGSSTHAAIDTSVLSTSKDSYGSFPSHLSSEGQADSQPYPGSAEDGSIPTSSRLARLERIHLNWKEQTTPKSSFIDVKRRERQFLSGSEDTDTAFIEDTQLGAQALLSQLQDTYSSTSAETSEDESEPGEESQRDQLSRIESDQQAVSRSTEEVLASARLFANSRDGSVHADLPEDFRMDDTFGSSLSVNETGKEHQKRLDDNETSLRSIDFAKLSVDAFPPAPKVSTARPGSLPSQVTKHLAAIKAQNPVRFKPSKKLRVPKNDDRGYWSVTCSHWPDKLQFEFWTSLSEQVLSGRLGWATTLHRDPQSFGMLGQVRLYCWGEVVEHMWLLLWLCSNGKVSGSRLKWVDAGGTAILEVP